MTCSQHCDCSKKTVEGDKEYEAAKKFQDMYVGRLASAEAREGELADEFTRLEVQIAAILIALEGAFSESITGRLHEVISSLEGIFVLKVFYFGSMTLLLLSLIIGLVLIKNKEFFWRRIGRINNLNLINWIKVVEGNDTFASAADYQRGSAHGESRSTTPSWPWILQTIFLGIAIFLFFIILLVLVFNN